MRHLSGLSTIEMLGFLAAIRKCSHSIGQYPPKETQYHQIIVYPLTLRSFEVWAISRQMSSIGPISVQSMRMDDTGIMLRLLGEAFVSPNVTKQLC